MTENISKEYEGEWVISTSPHPTAFKSTATPPFSPRPDNSVTFCFEALYQRLHVNLKNLSYIALFKLKLVKLSSARISPTLEVTVNVKVNYSDGSVFKEYESVPSTIVENMDDITFKDVITEFDFVTHSLKMQSETLIINCKMIFYDQAPDIITGNEMKSSSKCADLINHFKSMYESSMFSDFVFKVGDRSFPAHKIILAAHSPVFMNMMTHEFLESKTNTVIITDATPEVFDLFLRYLYAGELKDKSWNSLKELYYLADKYDVGFLKEECAKEITSTILSVDLVCETLKLAYSYSDAGLKTVAIKFAMHHIKEIVTREDWKELVTSHPSIAYEVIANFIPK